MATRTRQRRRVARHVEQTVGPFLGVRQNTDRDPGFNDPRYALDAVNLYARSPERGGGQVPRFGFTRATRLGSGSNRTGQGVFHHTALDGTEYRFAFCGGTVWRGSADLTTWTDVTPVGVSISTTARVYCATFADVMVVTDGVNRPWKATNLSSTPITGAYLSGVPAAVYGPPAVYYAKLFFIKADERNTLIWSEENDPDTGYEAGGFNNAWQLGQTDQEGLYCLVGTNAALYYFRATSIGAISGAVTTNFRNDGVHDGVSPSVGTIYPASVVLRGQEQQEIHFVDATGKAQIVAMGGGVVAFWKDARASFSAPALDPATPFSVHQASLDLILHSFASTDSYTVLDPSARTHQGRWQSTVWQGMDAAGLLKADDGQYRVGMVARDAIAAEDGYLWFENASVGTDVRIGAAAITRSLSGPMMGYDHMRETLFDRMAAHVRGDQGASLSGTLTYETPRGLSGNLSVETPATVGSGTTSTKAEAGTNAIARYVIPSISSTTFGAHYGFTVRGVPLSDHPGAP